MVDGDFTIHYTQITPRTCRHRTPPKAGTTPVFEKPSRYQRPVPVEPFALVEVDRSTLLLVSKPAAKNQAAAH